MSVLLCKKSNHCGFYNIYSLLDVFLTVMEITPDLQNRACSLLECWWNGEKEGREGLIPNSLLYLLARTLNEGAKVREREREKERERENERERVTLVTSLWHLTLSQTLTLLSIMACTQ